MESTSRSDLGRENRISPSDREESQRDKITVYHWLVVIIASCGWLFDCMDQRLFILARESALTELLGDAAATVEVNTYGGHATTAMILGWATGGIVFGMMSDKWGRVKTMAVTLLMYAGFTGLSGIAHHWVEFTAYRFLAGLGIGGMFGAATTLVAETVPGRMRAVALGALQALAALGNILGSLVSLIVQPGAADVLWGYSGWRLLFFVGILPSLLVIPIVLVLREPEAWTRAREEARRGVAAHNIGSPVELFRSPRWRRNSIVGLLLGVSGMIGLWGIGFFSPELISTALAGAPQQTLDTVRGWGTALQDVGAFLGMITFTTIAALVSRRLAFAIAFLAGMMSTAFVFTALNTATDAYWMLPMMGFAQLAPFAGYSIYFPELFPTRLRGTGVGFCYNTVRYLAAPAPMLLGYLSGVVSFRTAAVLMSSVYLIGLIALVWAPETKGQPLPED
ncbi:MAG: MFS transporter [Luteitalea sp.]|nr:MFS transporter [Luteitalea sp.]